MRGPETADPGVQDGDGQPTQRVMGPAHGVDHGRLVGDVAFDRQIRRSGRTVHVDVPVDHSHRRPGGAQLLDDGQPDAGRATGDKRSGTLEVHDNARYGSGPGPAPAP